MKDEEIKKNVREAYAKIVQTGSSCCTPDSSSCGPVSSCCGSPEVNMTAIISKNIGYSDEELNSVPESANLGLGCGNPLAFAKLKEGDTILDLGSGAGFDCFLAANKVGKTGKVIGVDMTPEMINKARKNAKEGNFENVEFRLGEIEYLPVDDDSVDMVISNCVINLVPDKKQAFQEAYRVLKQGGTLMVSDIVLLDELPEVIRNSIDAYNGCVAGALLKENYLEAIKNAGFEEIIIHSSQPFPIDIINFNPEIIKKIEKTGVALDELKEMTNIVLSIKVEAIKPNFKADKIFPSDKLLIDIFVPLDTCACLWDQFMNSVFKVLAPYIKYINFSTKSTNSDEARKLNVYGNCIIVEGKRKFTSSFTLKKVLPDLLKEKGLL